MGMKYLWIDLETTGLDPKHGAILEFAAIATGSDLVAVDIMGGVLCFDIGDFDRMGSGEGEYGRFYQGDSFAIDGFVYDMHRKNGLWDDARRGLLNVEAMDEVLSTMIDVHTWSERKPILAGSSVHFDRAWLREYCPRMESKLHYRHFDVTTLKMAVRDAIAKSTFGVEGEAESRHRAASDLEHSLQVARDFQRFAQCVRTQ